MFGLEIVLSRRDVGGGSCYSTPDPFQGMEAQRNSA